MTYETSTTDSAATQNLARQLSQLLVGGEVIELVSDLGGGKTTFVQGLAAGLGFTGPVTSPTFTLNNTYELPSGRNLYHYDLYRLEETGIVGSELMEGLSEPGAVTVIEWPGLIESGLPADRLKIEFVPTSDTSRQIIFTASGPVSERIVQELNQ